MASHTNHAHSPAGYVVNTDTLERFMHHTVETTDATSTSFEAMLEKAIAAMKHTRILRALDKLETHADDAEINYCLPYDYAKTLLELYGVNAEDQTARDKARKEAYRIIDETGMSMDEIRQILNEAHKDTA